MTSNNHLEQRLWDAADELRANSKLKASEYSAPVLGLIFLRYADHKFGLAEKRLSNIPSSRRKVGKADYQAAGVLYLPAEARFDYLLNLAEGQNLGRAVNDAMKRIEAENEDLKGVLPRAYGALDNATLAALLKVVATIPMDIEGDAFGRIYEYFLGKFAMAEGQKGGEFFTPTPLVKLIVSVIEPFHGRIYDPACGSGGMFVQSAHFVERQRKNPNDEISIYGQEKTSDTVKLCKMNLAVHGLSGDIREVTSSFYEDLHNSPGQFDFVMANPPFNVDGVDFSRISHDARRFPFGMPKNDNANYLWIQLFYSALNTHGRAGFIMHNSAADAEREIREALIQENVVDAVVLTTANLFYTVSLPCTLWFMDKQRAKSKRRDTILFVDARHIYEQVDTAHRTISDEQIEMLAGLVHSYRGSTGAKPYMDVPGLCRSVSIDTVASKNYSLNPKLYVEPLARPANRSAFPAHDLDSILASIETAKDAVDEVFKRKIPNDARLLSDAAQHSFLAFYTPQAPKTQWKEASFRELTDYYIGGVWGSEVPKNDSVGVRAIRGTDLEAIRVGEVSSCPIRYISKRQLESRALRPGDLVIEVSGGGKDQPTGRCAFITAELLASSDEPMVYSNFCKLLRLNSAKIRPALAFEYLQYLYDHRYIERYEVQSTGIKNFKFEVFLDTEKMYIGPDDAQNRAAESIERALSLVHLLGRAHELCRTQTLQLRPVLGE